MSLHVHECESCGHRVWPVRLWCPVCHRDRFVPVPVETGRLLAWTRIEGGREPGLLIATVQALPDGPVLVARLEQAPSVEGQTLSLETFVREGVSLPYARVRPPPA